MLTRFIRSFDGTSLAVTMRGDERSAPVIFVNPWTITTTEHGFHSSMSERVAAHRYLATYDRRGTGASGRDVAELGLDAQVNDVLAVADALELGTADIVGFFDSTLIAIAYAARFPERIGKLVLWHPILDGNDWIPQQRVLGLLDLAKTDWTLALRTLSTILAPRGPIDYQRALAKGFFESFTPDMFVRSMEALPGMNVVDEARKVQADTLILSPSGAGLPIRYAQRVASLIPQARLMPIEQLVTTADDDAVSAIIGFLDDKQAVSSSPEASSADTAIILFADVVESTANTERLGNQAFRERTRQLEDALRGVIREAGGSPVEGRTLGDGVIGVFTSAAQAIAAALQCGQHAERVELQLHLGIHAGDVIRESGGGVSGIAVSIASRISDLTGPNEILVSATVRDLARASTGVTFEDRGEREMKGVGEAVRVYAVVGSD